MRRRRTLGLITGLLVMLTVVLPRPVTGQVAVAPPESDVSLETALEAFSKKTGVSVVFADRLVRGLSTHCTSAPGRATDLLDCILADSGLEAEWTRNDQVVLKRSHRELSGISLTGMILDAETREPLPGVHVILSDKTVGVVSNPDGHFDFEVPAGESKLVFSHLGYETQTRNVEPGQTELTIFLPPQTIQASALLVEEDRRTTDDLLSGQDKRSFRRSRALPLCKCIWRYQRRVARIADAVTDR